MLRELRVENYAVIDSVVVEFGAGLNLLTGETGAGKSILIDALSLLLGEKASSEVIRHGAEKATVAAVYDGEEPGIARVLAANGLDAGESGLILRRDIAPNGKSRVFVNNQPATVAVLRELAPQLAIVHAQNQTSMIFDPPERLRLLDSAAGLSSTAVAAAYAQWHEIVVQIAELEKGEQEKLRLLDLWKFQLKEISEAAPEAGEDQRLAAEKRVLANSERVHTAALAAFDLLYEAEESAAARLRAAMRQIEDLAKFDEKFQESLTQLASARIALEDVATTVRDYAEGIDASPERLADVEDRLVVLERLRRKYGSTIEDVLRYAAEVKEKIAALENKDERLAALRQQLIKAASAYLAAARELSRQRAQTAQQLEKTVEAEINDLAMKVRFHIVVEGAEEERCWSATGFDQVDYRIATNPGEPMGRVEDIASGGELSRVMLALKSSIEAARLNSNGADNRRTLVFDEIDTGIGGRAANAVGQKLKALARSKQVLCVTHLPQIASFADHHFLIEKHEAGGRTLTTVRCLTPAERRAEIARMLSGERITEASLQNAAQLLKTNA